MTDMLSNMYPYGSRREPIEPQEPQEQQQQPIEQSQAPQEGAPLSVEKPESEERFRVVANGKDYNMTKQELRQLYSEGYGDGIEIAQPYTIGDQTYHFTKKEAESAKLELEKRNTERQKENIKNLQLDSGTYMSKQHGRLQSVPIIERDEAGNEVVIGKSVKRERGGAIWYDEGVKFGKQGAGWYDQFGRRAADSMSGQSKSILPSKKAHEARVKEETKGFMTADKAYTLQRLAQKEDYLSTFENHKYKDREFNKCRTAVIDGQNRYIRNGDNAVHMPDGPNGEGFYIKNPDGTLTRTKDFLAPEDATEMREIFKQQRQTRIENNRRNLLARGKTAEKIKEVTGSDFLADLPGDIGIGAKRVGLTMTKMAANVLQNPGVAEYTDEELSAISQIDIAASDQAKKQGNNISAFFLKHGADVGAGLAANTVLMAASTMVGGAAVPLLRAVGLSQKAAIATSAIISSIPEAGSEAIDAYNKNKSKYLDLGYGDEDAHALADKAWNISFAANMAILGGLGNALGSTSHKVAKEAWRKVFKKTAEDATKLAEKEIAEKAISKITQQELIEDPFKKLTLKEFGKETVKGAVGEVGEEMAQDVVDRTIDNKLQGNLLDIAKQATKETFSLDTIKAGISALPTLAIMSGVYSFGKGRNILSDTHKALLDKASPRIKTLQKYAETRQLAEDLKKSMDQFQAAGKNISADSLSTIKTRIEDLETVSFEMGSLYAKEVEKSTDTQKQEDQHWFDQLEGIDPEAGHDIMVKEEELVAFEKERIARILSPNDHEAGRNLINELDLTGIMTFEKRENDFLHGHAHIGKNKSWIFPIKKGDQVRLSRLHLYKNPRENHTLGVIYHEVGEHLGVPKILSQRQVKSLAGEIFDAIEKGDENAKRAWNTIVRHDGYRHLFPEHEYNNRLKAGMNVSDRDLFNSVDKDSEEGTSLSHEIIAHYVTSLPEQDYINARNTFTQEAINDDVIKWLDNRGLKPDNLKDAVLNLLEGGFRRMVEVSKRKIGTGKYTKNEKKLMELVKDNPNSHMKDLVAQLAQETSPREAVSAFRSLHDDSVIVSKNGGWFEKRNLKTFGEPIYFPDTYKHRKKEFKKEEKEGQLPEQQIQKKIDITRMSPEERISFEKQPEKKRGVIVKKVDNVVEKNKEAIKKVDESIKNRYEKGEFLGFEKNNPGILDNIVKDIFENKKDRIDIYDKYHKGFLDKQSDGGDGHKSLSVLPIKAPTKIKVDDNTELESRGAATHLNKDNITLQSKVRESMKPMSNRVKTHQTLHELHWIKQDLQERADNLKKSGALLSGRVKEAVSQRQSNLDAIQQGLVDIYKKETKGLTKEQEAKDAKSFELLEAMKIPTTLVDEDGATRTTDPSDAMKRARDTVADALGAGNRKAGHKVLSVMEATGVISIRDEDLAGMRGLANLTSSETSIFPLSGLGWIRDSVKKFSHTVTGALYHEVGAHVGLEGILRNNHWTAIKNAIIDASINGDKETTEMWNNMIKLYRQEIPYTADIVTKKGEEETRTPKNVETSPLSFFKNADPASIKIALHEFLGQMANTIDQKKSKHMKGIKKELIDATIDMVGNYGIDPAKLKDIVHVMIEGGLRRAQHMAERRAGTGEYTPAEKRFIELAKANPTKTAQEIATELATEVGPNEASSAFTSLKQDSVIIPQDSFFHEVPRHKQSRGQVSINLQEFGRVSLMSDHLNMPQTAIDRSVKAALSAIQKKKEEQKPLASKESVSEPDIFASLTDTGKELYNKLTSNNAPKGPQITIPSYKKLFSKPMLFTMPRAFLELHSDKVRKLGSSINDYVGKVNSVRREFSKTREDLSNHAKGNPRADKQLGLLLGMGSVYKNADDTVGRVFSFEEAQRHVPELTKETFDLYTQMTEKMKEAGKKLLDSYKVLHQKIAEQLKANFEGEELQRKLEKNDEAFNNVKAALSNPAYWPLSRQGKYKTYFYAKNAKGENVPFAVVMHDNKGKKGEAEIQAKLEDIKQQSTWANKKFNDGDFTTKTEIVPQTPDAFASGISSLDSVMGDYIAAAAKIDPKVAAAISTELLSATMDNNIATRMLKRGGIPGWDTNAASVFDRFLSSISNAIANNEHAFDMNEALKEFAPEKTGNNYDKNLHDEAIGLVSHAKNPPQSPIINRITQIGFIKHMGFSMGFAVINKLQMMQTVIPTLANFYGLRKAAGAAALGEYIADVVSEIHRLDKSLDTSDPKETMSRLNKVLTKKLLQSYFGGKATDEVLINTKKSILHTVAKSLDAGALKVEESMGLEAGKAGELLDKISKVSGVLAVKTEQSNRLATLIAYTILASENGGLVLDDEKGWHLDPEMKHDHSKEAERINEITNFVRGRGSQPAYLRQRGWGGAALKSTFNYKSFTAGTLHLFHSLGLLNARKEKTKAAKAWAYAKPQLMHITSAALLGGPKAAVWFSILSAILPDEWIEELTSSAMKFIESKMQGAVKYSLGVHDDKEAKKIAKRTMFHLKHGVIPNALAGIDVHGNLDFNLVQESNNKWEQIARGMMGSTVGDLTNIGVKVATGDKYGAIQGATPRFVKPLVDAATGKTHIGSGKSAELSTGDRVRRAIGVNTTEVSMVRDRQSQHIEFVTKQRDLLNNIMKEFREDAKRNNGKISSKAIKDAMKEVRDFNKQNKEKFQEFRLKMIKPTQVTGMRKRIMKGQKNLKWTISASGSDLELED